MNRKKLTVSGAGLMIAVLLMSVTNAADLTWDNGAATGNWNTTDLNWSGATPWNNAPPDNAIFDTTGVGTVTLTQAITAGLITFNTAGYTINTSTLGLTLNTGITATESATVQSGVGGSIILGTNNTWSVAASKTLSVSSAISGAGGLTKLGGGQLVLSAANPSFSGGVTIKAGDVNSTLANSMGTAAVTIGDSANTGLAATWSSSTGNVTYANTISTTGTGTNSIFVNGFNPIYSGAITLGSDLSVITNNNSGSTIGITGGIGGAGNLTIQSNAANTASSAITISGVTLNFTGSITNSGTTTSTTLSNTTISTVIGPLVTGVTQNSANSALILSGANTFTSQLTVQNGTLSTATVNNVSVAGPLGNSALPVILGNTGGQTGTLSYTGATATSTKPFTMATGGTGAFNVTTAASILTLSGLIDGGGALSNTGVGTIALSGANTYSGGTILQAGTVVISNASSLGSGAVTVTGTSRINTTGGITYANDINIGTQTLTMQNPAATTSTATFSGVLSGSGTISLPNSGTNAQQGILAFTNAANSFTGNVNLSASGSGDEFFSFNSIGDGGTFSFAKNGNRQGVRYTGSSDITFNTRTITVAASMVNGNTADRQGMDGSATGPVSSFANNGTGTVTFSQNMVIGAMAAGNYGVLGFAGSNTGNNTFSGVIADPSGAAKLSIGKFDDGKWIISGANTYEAMAMIARGTLEVPTITTASSAQPLGINQAFQLGRGGDSGTLSFTGGDSSTDKQVFIGSPINATTGTGGGSILNNGTGALTFTNPTFNPLSTSYVTPANGIVSGVAPTATRTLTLGGSYTGGTNTIQGVIQNNAPAGVVNLAVSGSIWALSGANTYSGTTTISAGTLNANSGNALGNSTSTNTLIFTGGTLQAGGAVTSISTRLVTLTNTGLFDTNGSTIAIAGVMSGAGGVTKSGLGALTLSGNNTYTGNTTISAGTVVAQNANALGTGGTRNVSVASGAGLNYAAAANANLSITGTLDITGGAGTVIGGTVGGTLTGAQVAVTGAATISDAAHVVNIYGIPGITTGTSGTYTLITGGSGSSLNPTTVPALGTVLSNTNFVVNTTGGDGGTSAFVRTPTTLGVAITQATALTAAFWNGGLTGATNVWAASDGTVNSNWVTAAGGGATPLVPGVGADVTISATSVSTAPTATVLGANMTIKSMTLADTTNGLGLVDDGNILTITPLSSAVGITMNASVPTSTIAARVALGAAQTWTNDSANNLTFSGSISGAFALTKAGTGTVVFSGINTYSGGTTISAGTLALTGSNNNLFDTGAVNITSAAGILNISAKTIASETVGSLAGVASSSVVLGSNNLTAGGDNTSTVFDGVISGTSGSLTKAGSGSMTLGGINTYTGATALSAGTLRLTNTSAISTTSALSMATGTTLQLRSNTVGTFTNTRMNPTGTITINADNNGSGSGNTLTLGGTVVYVSSATSSIGFTGSNIYDVGINAMYFNSAASANTFTLNPTTANAKIGVIRVNTSNTNPDGFGAGSAFNVGLVLGGTATNNTITSIAELSNAATQLIITKNTAATWSISGSVDTKQGNVHTISAGTLNMNGGSFIFGLNSATARTLTVSGTGVLGYNNAAAVQTLGTGAVLTMTGGSIDNTSGAAITTSTTNPNMSWGGNWAFIGTNGASSNLNLGTGPVAMSANSQVTVTNPATTLTVGGIISGAFALTKAGAGTLTLAGANAYTGGTNVNAGTLLWSGTNNLPATGALAVNAGGNFSLADGTARTTTANGGLTLASGSLLTFEWTGASTGDRITSTANIQPTAGSNIGIAIVPSGTPSGSVVLITGGASSTLSSSNFFLANTNFTATITKAATTVTIGSYAAVSPQTLLFWQGNKVAGTNTAGVDNALSLSTGAVSNWSTAVGTYTATALVPGSTADVIFSTTDTPAQQTAAILGADMTVKSVTFNDAIATTIGGGNSLTLTSTVATAGTGTAGGGSAITVTSAAANPTISAPVVLGASQTWNVASGKILTVSGSVGGGAGLTKEDTGTLILSAANTYAGITNINAGTLKIGSGTSLGTQTGATDRTIIASGATLDLGGVAFGVNNEFITASGAGVGGNGAITSSTAIATPFIGVRFLTLTGDTTLGFTNRWDVGNNSTGGTLTGGGFTLNISGSGAGQASFNGLGETDLGDININLGSAASATAYFQGNTTLGQPAKTVTISGGSTLDVFTNSTLTSYDKKFALNTGNITIEKTGGVALPGTISLAGATNTITANTAAVTITASGIISGNGALTKAGAGTLTLTNSNTYDGVTTINAGTLQLGNGTATGSLNTASAISVGTGATFAVNQSDTVTQGTDFSNAPITGLGGFRQAGAGTTILNQANTYTGNTVVSAGTLQIDGSYAVAGTGTTSQLQIGSGAGTNGTMVVSATAGTLTFGGDGFTNAAQVGVSGGTGTLTINGGIVNLAGTTGTASTTLHIGGQVVTAAGTGTVTLNAGTLNVGQRILMGFNNAASNGTLTIAGGTVNVGYNGTLGYTGNDPGSVQFGAGTSTLNLNGGTLRLLGFKSAGGVNTNINFNGTTLVALGDNSFFMGNNGASDAAPNAAGTYTTKVKVGGALIDTSTFNITIATALVEDSTSAGGGLTKSGAGTLTLTGANTYKGTTTLTAGTLSVGATANLGDAASNLVFDGGTLQVTGTTLTSITGIGHTVSFNATKTVGLDINNVANTFAVDQVLNQTTGGLTKLGAGTAVLNKANTYTGATTISAGTLTIDDGSIASSSSITNNAALVYNLNANARTYANVIDGSGTLTKSGTNTLTLTGGNTYSGATTINSGALSILSPGSLAAGSAVTINGNSVAANAAAQSALRGTGTVNGSVTAAGTAITNNADAVVWPGTINDPASLNTDQVLTVNNTVNLSVSGKLAVVFNNAGKTQSLTAANLTLGGTSVLSLSFDAVASGKTFTIVTTPNGLAAPFAVVLGISGYVADGFTHNLSADIVYSDGTTTYTNPAPGAFSTALFNATTIKVVFNAAVTPVKIADFAAKSDGSGVNVSWKAVSEYKNAGFNIYRRNSDGGKWTLVNPALIAGRITNPDEKMYSFYDWASAGEWQYKLESVDLDGGKETYAQFAGPVSIEWNADLNAASEVDAGSVSSVNDGFVVMAGVRNAQAVGAAITEMKQDAVGMNKVSVRALTEANQDNNTTVVAARSVVASALSASTVSAANVGVRWFSSGRVSASSFTAAKLVYNKAGVMVIPQSSMPAGYELNNVSMQREGRNFSALAKVPAGLLVYAPGYADDYTDKDAVFIRRTSAETYVVGAATVTGLFNSSAAVNVSSPATVTNDYHDVYFDFSTEYRPFTFAPWFSSKYLTQGATQDFVVSLPQASGGSATLTVNLWSLTSDASINPDHGLQLVINGTFVGEASWDGGNKMMQLSFDVPSGVIKSGDNTVSVVTPSIAGQTSQIAFMHSIKANYTRLLDGSKSFEIVNNSGKSQLYELNNVPSTGAWVVDARFSDRASLVATETQVQGDGTLLVRFMASAGGSGKFVVTPVGQENQPISITARQVKAAKLNGTYLATGPSQFSSGVQPLLMKRSKEGIRGAYFDQEQLFDYYNYGRYGPDGIRNAVRSLKPKYLLLVGRTTYDYRNYEGQNVDPLCPTYLVSTSFWAQATSDSAFGDLGRGYPEVAVGRLPVNNTTELSGAINHILSYQGIPQSGLRLHAVADKADPTVADFGSELDALLKANQPDVSWQENYLGRTFASVADVTNAMNVAANGGADMIVYSGHGSAAHLGRDDPRILTLASVQDWTGNVVFLQSTCTANWMAKNVSGYKSVAIQALTQPQGGISASVGTSTYMNSDVAVSFNNQLLKSASKNARWGTALMNAQQWAGKQTGNAFNVDLMKTEQLFGDPAMPIFAPNTANTAPGNTGAGTSAGTF